MNYNEIRERLLLLGDIKNIEFSNKIIPNAKKILGISIPVLRNFAKEICKDDYLNFINNCQFEFYEETMLCGLVIAYAKIEIAEKFKLLDNYIPHIDNWAVNDSVAMTVKIKNAEQDIALRFVEKHLLSENEFELRFAIVLLFCNFVDEKHLDYTLNTLFDISSNLYYVNMAVAWGLCECIVNFPQLALEPFISCDKLDNFTFNKTISKCCDSFRVSAENKTLLKSKRRK
ncbi:MAG: DNA alkylation repair protein [Clostridia bacterium]